MRKDNTAHDMLMDSTTVYPVTLYVVHHRPKEIHTTRACNTTGTSITHLQPWTVVQERVDRDVARMREVVQSLYLLEKMRLKEVLVAETGSHSMEQLLLLIIALGILQVLKRLFKVIHLTEAGLLRVIRRHCPHHW